MMFSFIEDQNRYASRLKPTKMTKLQKANKLLISRAGEDVKFLEILNFAGGSAKWCF
jgi:hypothetical protein